MAPLFKDDLYFERIKSLIDRENKIISFENVNDMFDIMETSGDQNERVKMSIKSIFSFLNAQSNDTIIYLKGVSVFFQPLCQDFYTVRDLKKIVKICNKILCDIDFNQNKDDIVAQIYIKLGYLISYDSCSINNRKKKETLVLSESNNLMVLLNRKGVCQGIALALKFVLNVCGIECNIVSSIVFNESCHAYNQIKINEKWYNSDLCHDLDFMKIFFTKYFLRSKKSFSKQLCYQPFDESMCHEANEDYPNVRGLFMRNMFKLFKKKLDTSVEQLIEPAGIKDDRGRFR